MPPHYVRDEDVIKAAECSLKQLKIDYLDFYQLHWPNYAVPIAETMFVMEKLVEAGKIRFIGVRNFTVAEMCCAQAQLTKERIVSNQVRYSLVDRSPEHGLCSIARRIRSASWHLARWQPVSIACGVAIRATPSVRLPRH